MWVQQGKRAGGAEAGAVRAEHTEPLSHHTLFVCGGAVRYCPGRPVAWGIEQATVPTGAAVCGAAVWVQACGRRTFGPARAHAQCSSCPFVFHVTAEWFVSRPMRCVLVGRLWDGMGGAACLPYAGLAPVRSRVRGTAVRVALWCCSVAVVAFRKRTLQCCCYCWSQHVVVCMACGSRRWQRAVLSPCETGSG